MENIESQPTPLQPLPQPVQFQAKKSYFLKNFFIGLALILFGVLIGVFVSRFIPAAFPAPVSPPIVTPTPSPDDTAGWQTYTDSEAKYEIKYPFDATLSASSKQSLDIVYIGDVQRESGRIQSELSDGYKINIGYIESTPKQTLLSIANDNYQRSKDSCPIPEEVNVLPLIETKISGEPAIQFSTENCFLDDTMYFVEKSGKIFSIIAMFTGLNPDQQKHYQDQTIKIISTFKFTDSTSSNYTCPTNGWVDCMPVLDAAKTTACSREAMAWYKTNCPGFQGAAL